MSRLSIFLAMLLAGLLCAAPAPAQVQRLPDLSQIEPLPPAAGQPIGPEMEYFDQDAWVASDPSHLAWMGTNLGPTTPRDDWSWQLLPEGIIYQSYLANPRESRLGTQLFSESDGRILWDSNLGGHMGLLRYGTCDGLWPQGWQLDVEGGALVRLNPDEERDLEAADFRIGAPITYGYGRQRFKFGYYHLSSHVGDEFLIKNPTFVRQNFVRESLFLGYAIFATDNVRLYAEAGWAFIADVSDEWEFQFGLDWAPSQPTGIRGAPFFAVNGHLREELNYSGNFTVQAGWAWRGARTSHLLRIGAHYYNGYSNQYSFFRDFEEQIGGGVWYDF